MDKLGCTGSSMRQRVRVTNPVTPHGSLTYRKHLIYFLHNLMAFIEMNKRSASRPPIGLTAGNFDRVG